MPRLTLRTLLAYIDDTLDPAQARSLGAKVAESEPARELIERIKRVTRRRGLHNPVPTGGEDDVADPNTVAEYLSDTLDSDQVKQLEETCLKSDVHLAEVAAVHQILTLVLTEPVRVPPRANQRMYKLVEPPASAPNRRPRTSKAVTGDTPAAPDHGEPDDADAPYLLGMSRYGAASATHRLALAGAVVFAAVILAGAALMAVRNPGTEPSPAPVGSSLARATPHKPDPVVKPPAHPEPTTLDVAPMPREVGADPVVVDPKVPDPMPMVELGGKVPPANEGRFPMGRVETPNALVFTRPNDGPDWVRVDAAEPVPGQDELLSLPGFKADVSLDTKAVIHLWGNVPEQLGSAAPGYLPGARVPLEVRVRVHQAPTGFDADLTLHAGRVYLTTRNPLGAKFRIRHGGEVWDVRVKDDKTDVMAEVVTAFVPGTPYRRQGGEGPRTVARLAVTKEKGTAELDAPNRARKGVEIVGPAVVTWDSATGQLSDPRPIDRADITFARYLDAFILPARAENMNKAMADFVLRFTDPKALRLTLAGELEKKPNDTNPVHHTTYRLTVYAVAASAAGPDAADRMRALLDVLDSQTRGYARGAAADALSVWLARDPQNTARLHTLMVEKSRTPEDEADLILQLLRGFTRPVKPPARDLDDLVKLLTSRSLPVRELALWNLLNFVDPAAAGVPGLVTDVAFDGPEFGYDKFVNAWKARIEEVKKRPVVEMKEKK